MPHPANIPLTPQTNENNFPRWRKDAGPGQSGHPYPRMLTRICTPEDRAEWKEKNRKYDTASGREYWESAPPRVGSVIPITTTTQMVEDGKCDTVGEPVIVRDAEEEREILEEMGLQPKEDRTPAIVKIPIAASAPLAKPKRGRPRKPIASPVTPATDVWIDEASKD